MPSTPELVNALRAAEKTFFHMLEVMADRHVNEKDKMKQIDGLAHSGLEHVRAILAQVAPR